MSRRSELLALALVAACAQPPRPQTAAQKTYVVRLREKAASVRPLVSTAFARRFLDASQSLPNRSDEWLEGIGGNPVDYARPLDVAAERGATFDRVFDFGYGAIGHLCMLATTGSHVTGVDVRHELVEMYATRDGCPGDIRLFDGFYPTDPKIRTGVGTGFDFIVSKNTLKKGYIHPDRPVDDKHLIHLGVDDATFLSAFHDALRPEGFFLVYNLFVPTPEGHPFKPMSDGRTPFTRESWEAAGFTLAAFDEDDSKAAREVLARTKDPEDDLDLGTLGALFTLARRR